MNGLLTYWTKEYASLKATPYDVLFGVRPRNSDPISFTTQSSSEERLF